MKTDLRGWALELIRASRLEFAHLIASIPAGQRERRGELKRWSPKDELAHLAYWLEVLVGNLRARRGGEPLTDTRDYLAMNDAAWEVRGDWTWAEVERSLNETLDDLEGEIRQLSADELTDAERLSLTHRRPLLRDLTYELIVHPVHHFAGLYRKLGEEARIGPMRSRLLEVMTRRGVSRWSATTRRRLERYAG